MVSENNSADGNEYGLRDGGDNGDGCGDSEDIIVLW